MFNNVALDVIIGLIFIYLLYSLLATILTEIIAFQLGLRARNLKEAINRMLNDEVETQDPRWMANKLDRLWDSLQLMKNPKNPIIEQFYDHPEIKYLGSSGLFKNPSSFKAVSFSKTLLYLLNGDGQPLTYSSINIQLNQGASTVLGPETARYVLSLWHDSKGDLTKFKLQLEAWFDRTMEQATEWYKRKIQIILLLLGFILAWLFNADTLTIVKKLSTDKTAREQMVQMATSYMEKNRSLDSVPTIQNTATRDSLLAVKKLLEADIQKANSLLGTGSLLPDTLYVQLNAANEWIYPADIESDLLPEPDTVIQDEKIPGQFKQVYNGFQRWCYFTRIGGKHLGGFLLTALAISLGAPFWFDLLNKLMQLRTSIKQPTSSTNTNTNNTVLPSTSK